MRACRIRGFEIPCKDPTNDLITVAKIGIMTHLRDVGQKRSRRSTSILIILKGAMYPMHTEYEEFETIEDFFMYITSAISPMKNTLPISSYRGYLMSFVPLGASNGDSFLVVYAQATLEPGLYEFDLPSKSYSKVERVERADKFYFVVLTPKRNTLADEALKNI